MRGRPGGVRRLRPKHTIVAIPPAQALSSQVALQAPDPKPLTPLEACTVLEHWLQIVLGWWLVSLLQYRAEVRRRRWGARL